MKVTKAVKTICFAICIATICIIILGSLNALFNGTTFLNHTIKEPTAGLFVFIVILCYSAPVWLSCLLVWLSCLLIGSIVGAVGNKLKKEEEEQIEAEKELQEQDSKHQKELIKRYCIEDNKSDKAEFHSGQIEQDSYFIDG